MKIEHLAINVVDPLSTSRWYIENLGFTVKRRVMEEPWTHFLADDSGTVMLEIYGNKAHPATVDRVVALTAEQLIAAAALTEQAVVARSAMDRVSS